MNKPMLVLATAAALALSLTGCSKPQTAWITDFEAAQTASQKAKKDLLIAFTGSDWNDKSKALVTDAFTADFFKKGSKKFVMCNVDIVQDETKMDADALNANYQLATTYGVQSMPTFILVTPEGDVYASAAAPDDATTADTVLAFLDTFKDARKKIVDMKKKITSSKGVEKAKAIDEFIESIDSYHRDRYSDLIRQVPDLDADGSAGLKGKYQLQVAYIDALQLYEQGKMTEAGDLFLKLAEGDTLDNAQKQQAWYMGAYMNAMSGTIDNETIIGWLQKAYDADPQNDGAPQIKATIEQLKAEPAKTSK